MASSLDGTKYIIRWIFVYGLMGNIFTKVRKFCGFVFKYILGKDVEDDEIEKLILEAKIWNTFKGRTFPILPILMKCVCAEMFPFLVFL